MAEKPPAKGRVIFGGELYDTAACSQTSCRCKV